MARPREEIRLEIEDLLSEDSWDADMEKEFDRLIKEHPSETDDDKAVLGWYEEAAFLLRKDTND